MLEIQDPKEDTFPTLVIWLGMDVRHKTAPCFYLLPCLTVSFPKRTWDAKLALVLTACARGFWSVDNIRVQWSSALARLN